MSAMVTDELFYLFISRNQSLTIIIMTELSPLLVVIAYKPRMALNSQFLAMLAHSRIWVQNYGVIFSTKKNLPIDILMHRCKKC